MNFKAVVQAISDHVERLMREIDPQPPQLMAPERPMARPQSAPEEEALAFAVRRPWAVAEKIPPARPQSRLLRLKKRLRQPQSVREAIILKEILDRPLARRHR